MSDSDPQQFNPYASPQMDDIAERPDEPGWDTGKPRPPVHLPGAVVLLLVAPLMLPLIGFFGRLPPSRSFEFQWADNFFQITFDFVPQIAGICVGILSLLAILAWLFFNGRNRKVFGVLIALVSVPAVPAAIFLALVGLT